MKLKTSSAAKKRIKVTKTKKFIIAKAGKNHLLADKSKKAKGRSKYGNNVDATNYQNIARMLPHAL